VCVAQLLHTGRSQVDRSARPVASCAAALASGGRLAIKDFLLDPDATSPTFGTLCAVNMLVSTEAGDAYTVEQAAGWLRDAGLDPRTVVDLTRSRACWWGCGAEPAARTSQGHVAKLLVSWIDAKLWRSGFW
jgi:hypothetical protein